LINTGSVGALIVTGVLSTAASANAKNQADQRFASCLARFGVTDPSEYLDGEELLASDPNGTPNPFDPQQSAIAANSSVTVDPFFQGGTSTAPQSFAQECSETGSVIFGGTGYCTAP
jgi:hypothetical protein